MPELRCAAVILAAGASTRLGQAKQLIVLDGESLLRRTARLAVEAGCSKVVIVLGFDPDRMLPELNALPVEVILNPQWQEGMGSSLRRGIETITRSEPQPNAVLVLVCDQPRLAPGHLRALLARYRESMLLGRIIASVYAQRPGVPAIFPEHLFPDLLGSSGDRGARDLIRVHAAEVQGVPWLEGETDIDTVADLDRLMQRRF